MIKINVNDIDKIKKDFITRIEDSVIKNKLDNLTKTEKKELKRNTFENGSELQKRVHSLYLCSPENLIQEADKFQQYLIQNHSHEIETIKSTYFDYESIILYKKDKIDHAYWLMKKLNIRVCPYCNRSYTFTVINGEVGCRPEFDHFYCQDNNPYLSLSFYNLVPSCPTCNHKKSTEDIYIHPYIEGFENNCKLKINNIGNCLLNSNNYENWSIGWSEHDVRFDQNINTFLLTHFYNEHKDYISEIIFKAKAYNTGYYQTLLETFLDLQLSPKEMRLLVFGNYTEIDELGLRPLSKLSRDIIEQIGIDTL